MERKSERYIEKLVEVDKVNLKDILWVVSKDGRIVVPVCVGLDNKVVNLVSGNKNYGPEQPFYAEDWMMLSDKSWGYAKQTIAFEYNLNIDELVILDSYSIIKKVSKLPYKLTSFSEKSRELFERLMAVYPSKKLTTKILDKQVNKQQILALASIAQKSLRDLNNSEKTNNV